MNARQVSATALLIEYFMHPTLLQESDRRHRARILIVTLLFFAAILAPVGLVVALASFPLASKIAALVICFCLSAGCICGLFALRRNGRFVLCSMLVVAADVFSITCGILVSGGGAVSPVTQLLAFPPLLGYFFGGIRWGSITSAVSLLEIIIFAWLARAGVHFYTANDPDKASDAQLVIGIVGLVAVSAMAFIYEYTAAMLKRERDSEQARVNALARIDALTGVSNRHGVDAELELRIGKAKGVVADHCFALCCLDLDGFKPINDKHGHDVGDEVLREISSRLQKALRSTDCIGRHGGDEFLLILDSQCDAAQLNIIAERLRKRIAAPIATSAGNLQVGGSFGFAIFPDHAADADALKHAADAAMYVAKRSGGGWRFYRPGGNEATAS